MKLIESKTLGTAQASIEFTSIPQDGTDLLVLMSLRDAGGSNANDVRIRFNTLSTNFSTRYLFGNGSITGSGTQSTNIVTVASTSSGATSNTFSSVSLYIPNYTGSTNKSFSVDTVGENNATGAFQILEAGLWSNTAAISGLTIEGVSVNLVAGSIISLYKITKGSDGIVTTS
jgi:hypothetical protein